MQMAASRKQLHTRNRDSQRDSHTAKEGVEPLGADPISCIGAVDEISVCMNHFIAQILLPGILIKNEIITQHRHQKPPRIFILTFIFSLVSTEIAPCQNNKVCSGSCVLSLV